MRPLWLVAVLLLTGVPLVAAIIALGTHFHGYEIFLYSILAGLAGGIFAALWTDRLNVSSRFLIVLTGVLLGLSIYGLQWLFASLYAMPDPGTTFWDYVQHRAHNATLGRMGRTWFNISPLVFTIISLFEIGLVAWLSGFIARRMHDVFGKV